MRVVGCGRERVLRCQWCYGEGREMRMGAAAAGGAVAAISVRSGRRGV